ncbi:MAG: hypothetical protein NZL98_11190, partial [Anaerolineales bacterium]|nr:hypothetical protein [Anaerolineales bacterium]
RLNSLRDSLEDLHTQLNGLLPRLASGRSRGYVFEKGLESQAEALVKQWQTLEPSLQQQLTLQSNSLQASLRPIEMQMMQLNAVASNPAAARPLLMSLKTNIEMLEDKISAAEQSIRGMYDAFAQTVFQLARRLADIEYMLTQLAEASFQLLPTEAGIAAVKAVWCRMGQEQKDDPKGVLFLTDQRILFEQKEEITTKKVLFIATEKQKVQRLLIEIPVALVDTVTTSKAGFLKNEDHIHIRFQPGAPYSNLQFHIWQDCTLWQGWLNRARSKEFDQERVVPIDEKVIEKIKSAPTECPSCGATLDVVILRGQESIQCEYCGSVIRL